MKRTIFTDPPTGLSDQSDILSTWKRRFQDPIFRPGRRGPGRLAARFVALAAALAVWTAPLAAQLSREQKLLDMQQLAALAAKQYAPYEWKRDALGFDLYELRPWLDRAAQSRDDAGFYEVCAEYLASFQDLHTGFYVPSDFSATIGLAADLYDGRVLIDTIRRDRLPAAEYPFEAGDEIVSVDGEAPLEFAGRVVRWQSFAHPRATVRWALDQLFWRDQAVIPRAHELGDAAVVRVRRKATGQVEERRIPWTKSGVPLAKVGPVPSPRSAAGEDAPEPWMRTLDRLQRRAAPRFKRLRNFGGLLPAFTLPGNFTMRQGRFVGDRMVTGAWESDGVRIGFLRIPTFEAAAGVQSSFLRALDGEIDWLKRNTDVLVVDVMRNPGGHVCFANEILRRLIDRPFRMIGDEFRPTRELIQSFRDDLEIAKLLGADQVTQFMLQSYVDQLEMAYSENRGRTGQLPACGAWFEVQPLIGSNGLPTAYDKPVLALIDEFSASSADAFPAVLQDTGRALLYGMATAGGGGIVSESKVGFYSEASATISISMGVREGVVRAPGLPPTSYLENVGARPDIEADFMTEENLRTGGKPFVEGVAQTAVKLARGGE
jgi:C-terminal processing protease CtpA/Prc